MIIFSFNKCTSESEARKVKKIYIISFIVLFIVLGLIVGLVSEILFRPIYEGLGEIGENDFAKIDQASEKIQKVILITRPLSFFVEAFDFYLTVWVFLKLGTGKVASILWGFVALAPVVSFIPFIVIITRKFSLDQTTPITQT